MQGFGKRKQNLTLSYLTLKKQKKLVKKILNMLVTLQTKIAKTVTKPKKQTECCELIKKSLLSHTNYVLQL